MSRRPILSMRDRLILLVLLAMLPALGLLVYTAAEQRRLDAERAQLDAQRQAAFAAADFDRAVVGVRQVLLLLAQMPELHADVDTCNAFLAEILKSYPMYGNFNLIPPGGTVRCASLPSPSPVYLGDRSYFQRALADRSFAVGDFTIGRTTGRPSIVFALPVFDPSGEPEAILSVGLDLSWLNRHLAEVKWPEGTTLTLLDQGGTIVGSYPDPTRIGVALANQPDIRSVLTQREGTGRMDGPGGQSILLGFSTSDIGSQAAQVHVLISIPEQVALAAADRQLLRGLALIFVAALLAVVAAWVVGDRLIARRVNRMVQTTQAIEAGDLSARTQLPHDNGELGQLAQTFDQMAADLEGAYLGTVEVLADAVETRDPYTGGHVKRVSDYSLAIGREMGWNEKQLLQLQMAAALHDVGKIGVPDAVLRKQGPLDDQELPVMRSHTMIGAQLLEGVEFLLPARECALSHQEFFDGRGYPRGLEGQNIAPEARVVAIADTFDAMTTDRPYRKGLGMDVALAEIQRCAGTQFDPDMVAAFLRAVEAGVVSLKADAPPSGETEEQAVPASVAVPR